MTEAGNTPFIEKRLRRAALLIAVGLVIQAVTFCWIHALAFIAFLGLGCPLVAGGFLFYLYAIISHR